MLQNNLDPRWPSTRIELVVYGGTGKLLATGEASTRSSAPSAELERDETLLVSIRRGRSACCGRTSGRRAVLIANSNLVPDWSDLGGVPASSRRWA